MGILKLLLVAHCSWRVGLLRGRSIIGCNRWMWLFFHFINPLDPCVNFLIMALCFLLSQKYFSSSSSSSFWIFFINLQHLAVSPTQQLASLKMSKWKFGEIYCIIWKIYRYFAWENACLQIAFETLFRL